jgi:hypothetical protein
MSFFKTLNDYCKPSLLPKHGNLLEGNAFFGVEGRELSQGAPISTVNLTFSGIS